MKIVGAGFGRTGTTSLKAALEKLGFDPCYHMTEVFAHPEHANFWVSAWRGEPVDWDGVLGEYQATLDWPACTFYEELMERNPDAKVILTVRNPERWYESARTTIYELSMTINSSPVARTVFGLISLLTGGRFADRRPPLADEIIWDGTFDGRFEDRDHAIRVFEAHNEEVRQKVPSEKLLVYEVGNGWGPLCEFLGVEEPDEPFPRLNDAAETRRGIATIRAISAAAPIVLALLLAGGLYLGLSRLGRAR